MHYGRISNNLDFKDELGGVYAFGFGVWTICRVRRAHCFSRQKSAMVYLAMGVVGNV